MSPMQIIPPESDEKKLPSPRLPSSAEEKKNARTADLLEQELLRHYRREEFPALLAQAEEWRKTRPLAGVRVFDATPVFRNTLGKYMALLRGGAELTVGYSDFIPHDENTLAFLDSAGIQTAENDLEGETDVVLDCAGVHRKKRVSLGYVELTRSGVERYRTSEKPVFVADSSRIKRIETSLGTGESCLRALRALGYGELKGVDALLFGYGKVGRGIAMYLADAGALVTVVDALERCPSAPSSGLKCIDSRSGAEIRAAISGARLVVSATAVPGALTPFASLLNSSGAILVNMGVDDEFGPSVPPERVLNRKKPLNFILEEPTHMKYIDPTMALDNEGAKVLLEKAPFLRSGPFEPEESLEREILSAVCRAGVIEKEIERIALL